ncbi:hypothetical protein [Streptomyces sp. MI02-7b]|uniref:hypothetical protein n=1 Tax=Streptomyces sp. MI02-7b TaxID=462941 RepID=UPI0029BF33A4|nr:hypothetical protein [Streptomyces sp. MI02-7b]MDX3074317.1 hypothetical protein [Streptomyces sp. MI02-7b]
MHALPVPLMPAALAAGVALLVCCAAVVCGPLTAVFAGLLALGVWGVRYAVHPR